MSHETTVRSFKLEDMACVVDMLQSVSVFKPEDTKFNELATSFLENDSSYACVAVCEGRAIGFGSVFIIDRIRGGRAAIIEDVVVHEDARGKGVGKLIINKLIDHAKVNGCFKVNLVASTENAKFYEQSGFEEYFLSMKLSF